MNSIWVIKVTYLNYNQVNFNEGFKNYDKAKAKILKKINPEYMKTLSDYKFLDLENDIEYELKVVDIYD